MRELIKTIILHLCFRILYRITGAKTEQGLKNMIKYYTDNECDLEDIKKQKRSK